jgi:3-oxoadipate enol-lactonase
MAIEENVGRTTKGLAFRDCGDRLAPVLIFVNSIGLTHAVLWNWQLPVFVSRYRTILYDQRGHGASATPAGFYDIADLGCDLVELLDELKIVRASICGISLGGLVAMWVAAKRPERVERLVVVCSSAHPNDEAKWSARIELARKEGMHVVVSQGSKGWFSVPFAETHSDLLQQMRDAYARTDVEGYAGCCAALRSANLIPLLPSISAPTLVIAGGLDRGFPPQHAQMIVASISGSRLLVFEDAAHIACIEKAADFNRAVLDHLQDGRRE